MLQTASVVFSTCSNALSNIALDSLIPEVYITDENAQGTEVTCAAVR